MTTRSASCRSSLAFATVVCIRSCSISCVTIVLHSQRMQVRGARPGYATTLFHMLLCAQQQECCAERRVRVRAHLSIANLCALVLPSFTRCTMAAVTRKPLRDLHLLIYFVVGCSKFYSIRCSLLQRASAAGELECRRNTGTVLLANAACAV